MDMLAGYGSGSDDESDIPKASTAAIVAQTQKQPGQQAAQQQQQKAVPLPAAGPAQAPVQLPSPETLLGGGQPAAGYVDGSRAVMYAFRHCSRPQFPSLARMRAVCLLPEA